MIAMPARPPRPPAAVDVDEFVEQLFALEQAGDTTALLRLIKERLEASGPRPRKYVASGVTRVKPRDKRDWWLIELDLPDAAKRSIELALRAAAVARDEILTAGALCKWSAADLREMGVEPAAVEHLRRALAMVRLRLRGDR